ncbi:hypothetical protein [Paractinoplanes abujensis]|uniref:Uncharacterized protein n=1 Tax=Paractinoplanes abujensis TaxID=882441 RepID=A0A7W7CS03_9ACTN|nr:hypothetical protein [Actinoplanes abujensis]MBB4692255.1 hypothetical protein [Actinoplanes abujensis]
MEQTVSGCLVLDHAPGRRHLQGLGHGQAARRLPGDLLLPHPLAGREVTDARRRAES